MNRSRTNGLIGDPLRDDRYTYGHGFAMLFLSQVLGEEEDAERREQLIDVLTRAVVFTGRPRPRAAAGATSAPRTATISTKARPPSPRCRGCAAAATPASPCPRRSSTRPSIHQEMHRAGRRRAYNLARRRRRPAGHHGRRHRLPVQRRRLRQPIRPQAAEVLQEKPRTTSPTRASAIGTTPIIIIPRCCTAKGARSGSSTAIRSSPGSSPKPAHDGSWNQGYIGTVYTTAINLIILQMPNGTLPIYQR